MRRLSNASFNFFASPLTVSVSRVPQAGPSYHIPPSLASWLPRRKRDGRPSVTISDNIILCRTAHVQKISPHTFIFLCLKPLSRQPHHDLRIPKSHSTSILTLSRFVENRSSSLLPPDSDRIYGQIVVGQQMYPLSHIR